MDGLTIRDMMTPDVKTLREDDSLRSADWEMVVAELRHLPVIDRDRHVIGMVSDRDVLRAAVRPGEDLEVRRAMSRDVSVIEETAPAIEAATMLLESKYGALPVVDDLGRLVGIVTTTDFVELARRGLAGLDVHAPHVRA